MLDKLFTNFNVMKPFERTLEYPKEYNPRVHGAYDPSRFYGKAQPLTEVKLGEVGNWFSQRNMSFAGFRGLASRALWRYRIKYIDPRRANAAFIYQFIFVAFTANYFLYDYAEKKKHTWALYH